MMSRPQQMTRVRVSCCDQMHDTGRFVAVSRRFKVALSKISEIMMNFYTLDSRTHRLRSFMGGGVEDPSIKQCYTRVCNNPDEDKGCIPSYPAREALRSSHVCGSG